MLIENGQVEIWDSTVRDFAGGYLQDIAGIATLAQGGLGSSLSDPGANKLLGWDDTDNATAFFALGSGLSYDHASHTLSAPGGGGGGTVTDVTANSPLHSSGGTTPNITIDASDATHAGALSAADWNTFNGKQASSAKLDSIAALASAAGWLHNNGAGVFAYSTPNASDVGLGNVSNNLQLTVANNLSDLANAATARTNLGVAIGSNVQAWDADLDAIAAIAGTSGLLKKTAANTWSLDTSTYATQAYADALVVGLLDDRGNYNASGNTFPASGGSGAAGAILKGDLWTISVAGTLGGHPVTAGDVVRALVDTPGQTDANWAIGENNFGYVALNQALADGKIYVGNGSGIGTAVTPSGDVTISNAGVTAIGANKVTLAMVNSSALANGILPRSNGTNFVASSFTDNGLGTVTIGALSAVSILIGPDAGSSTVIGGSNASGFSADSDLTIFGDFNGNGNATWVYVKDSDQEIELRGVKLVPFAAGSIDIGATSEPFKTLYLSGSSGTPASNYFKLTGASTSGMRTVTLPDSDTKVPIASQFLTFSGPTAARTWTAPDANFSLARIDAAQTFAGTQTYAGNQVPSLTDTYDLGTSLLLWRKGWLSELDAVLFAQNTISVVGGWMMIAKNEGLIPVGQDIATGNTTIDFGQAMTANDFVIFRAAGAVEYVQVLTLSSGTRYNVTRDLDGSGANAWPAGSVYVVLGNTTSGRIELNSNSTPRISMIVQGATYNAQTEMARMGDLNGNWGIGSETYGFASGQYGASGKAWFSVDPTNGVRLGSNVTTRISLAADGSGYVANSLIAWDTSGNLTITGNAVIGGVTIGSGKMYIGTGTYNNTNTSFYVDSTGQFSLKDKLVWSGTALTISGTVTATAGTIGGWTLGATSLSAGSGATTVAMDSGGTNPAFYAGSATPGSAPFRVTNAGALTATNATITGSITATSGSITGNVDITAGGLTFKQVDGLTGLLKWKTGSATDFSIVSYNGDTALDASGAASGGISPAGRIQIRATNNAVTKQVILNLTGDSGSSFANFSGTGLSGVTVGAAATPNAMLDVRGDAIVTGLLKTGSTLVTLTDAAGKILQNSINNLGTGDSPTHAGLTLTSILVANAGGLQLGRGTGTLATGDNNNVALPTNKNIVTFTGPSGAYNISGFANAYDGRIVIVNCNIAQTLTIKHDNSGSTSGQRITTPTQADVTFAANKLVRLTFYYDQSVGAGVGYWVLHTASDGTTAGF